mgnify:CR=1 FL=1
MEWGQILALVAAALAVILPGMGSSKGVGLSGETASGVSTENPEVASKLLVLQLLPATQGIYGFLIAVIIMINTGALSGSMVSVSVIHGLELIVAALPVAVVGYFSAIRQGRVAAASINLLAKKPDDWSKGMVLCITVEFYAILSLLASMLMIINISG